ncbi:MAG: TonB-dependent receptor [Gemmatimonadota bacterium]|nr:TonB-dependent receptor [Gemmatimonadota bacterium]
MHEIRRFGSTAWAALALCVLPGALAAQGGALHGEVLDARAGTPIAGAEVRVVGAGLQARTDAQGRYVLEAVEAGAHEVEASVPGFRPARRATVVSESADAELDFYLQPAALQTPQIEVIGTRADALERIPGSAVAITRQQLLQRIPLSGNEVFRSVPGVHVQEEEGLGLRANIGIRGLDPDRSRTVLVLEDGVPVVLGPYGEPEMYYTPPIDRMARVEVVKGSGSILFGPQTVGGVINYVTPDPPERPQGSLDLRGGSGGFLSALASYGGTWENAGATASLLRKQADDVRGLFFGVTDFTGKLAFALGDRSEASVKLSVYDEESNSTYVGLTEEMFRADPSQHPAPDDRLRVRRYAASATHNLILGADAVLRTTGYAYSTVRDWQRQDFRYTGGGSAIEFLGTTGNRNRSFDVAGIEPRLQWNHRLFGTASELDAGVRAHYERARDQHINGGTATSRTGEIRDDEIRNGYALAGYLQNRFQLGDHFRLTPGVRLESFTYDRNILRTRVRREDPANPGRTTYLPEDVDIRTSDAIFEVIPGLGASWLHSPRVTVFAGAHRGFAPPRIKDALVYEDLTFAPGGAVGDPVSLQLDAERSWNFEVGTRAEPLAGLSVEATAFLLDFTNQIIPPSLSAGSVAQAQLANQGETRHTGIESGVAVDLGRLLAWPFSVTGEVKHTYVQATFSADRFMQTAAGDTANVRGNRLPYAPEHLLAVGLAIEHPAGLGLRLDGSYVAEQFSDNFETVTPGANGRTGLIPAYQVWDLAGSYRLRSGLALTGTVKNLLDETYIASRRPQGIKPGLPRQLQVGVRMSF